MAISVTRINGYATTYLTLNDDSSEIVPDEQNNDFIIYSGISYISVESIVTKLRSESKNPYLLIAVTSYNGG